MLRNFAEIHQDVWIERLSEMNEARCVYGNILLPFTLARFVVLWLVYRACWYRQGELMRGS